MVRNIYFFCPDPEGPAGGVKKIYDQVEILNKNGLSAYVLHHTYGASYPWSKHKAPIAYLNSPYPSFDIINSEKKELPAINQEDILVIPEGYVDAIFLEVKSIALQNTPLVIFNQRAYRTLEINHDIMTSFRLGIDTYPPLYNSTRLLGIITVSEDNFNYLRFLFPNLEIAHFHISVNPSIFVYSPNKKRQIAYMSRKCKSHCTQIIQLLKTRNYLANWSFILLDHVNEEIVAKTMQESAIFLNFSELEGFSLPSLEAMLCGCIVIGYHGEGGKEYFKQPYAYPINHGDIQTFSRTIEEIALSYEQNPSNYSEQTKAASTFIQERYSREIEEKEVMEIWSKILERHARYA